VAAHAVWGIMPLYLLLVRRVPSLEFVAWRIIFTLPVCLAVIAWQGHSGEIRAALRDKRTQLALMCSSLTIGANWLLYVIAIQTDHIYAASLGYYILPLSMMLLGLVVLREKLSRIEWIAVVLAAIGVGLLAAGAVGTLLFSVSIAITFGVYGLIRKMVNVGAISGLTIETLLLYIPAIGIVAWYALQPGGSSMAKDIGLSAAIMLGGPMTAVPLMLFTVAARRMNYSTIGFLQFLSPTIVFLLGLFWFQESLKPAQLGCFMLIWLAMALFIWNLFSAKPRPQASGASG
jgi:chloramphenicol-sensitive protein RarD